MSTLISFAWACGERQNLLTLVLAESALETIPRSLWTHPSIKRYSERREKPPQFLLLDRSYHHAAMRRLRENEKRGRPDIVHIALLEALGSPLNKERFLQVYVHTFNDYVIRVNPEVRLPKNYNRFVGLIEQLFQLRTIPPTGPVLLRLEHKTLSQLFHEAEVDCIIAFSTRGSPKTLEEVGSKLQTKERPAVIIGGFPRGNLLETTVKLADEVISVDQEMLEAWILISRLIYEYERAISLPKKRVKQSF